jgi:hypothetical protein
MWLLIATLCIQTSATDAECRRDVRGPYHAPLACREMLAPVRDVLVSVAGDLGAVVLFASVRCEKGNDL